MKLAHLIVLSCVAFITGCASTIARSDDGHKPGTLYPGPRDYINNWSRPSNESAESHAYGTVFPVLAVVGLAPFCIGDFVASTALDTLALPYDLSQKASKESSNKSMEGDR